MKVRFTDDMGPYESGSEWDIPDHLGRRALRLNRAERVETATRRPPENTAARTRRPEEEPAICGAETASGGTCQRAVEGGGHCWQHDDHKTG